MYHVIFFTKSSNSPNFQMCLISQTRVITACQLCDGWGWSRKGSRMQRMPPSRPCPEHSSPLLLTCVSICLVLEDQSEILLSPWIFSS